MKRNYFLYGCLLLAVCSCGKNEAEHKLDKVDARKAATETINDNPTDIMGFYSFIEAPSNGTFGLTQFAEYTNPYPPPSRIQRDNTNDSIKFDGAFYDANKNIIPGGKVRFGRFEFLPNPGKGNLYSMSSYNVVDPSSPLGFPVTGYRSMEGQTWNYTIDPNAGATTARGAAMPISGSLYFPKRVDLFESRSDIKTTLGSNIFTTWTYDGLFGNTTGAFTVNWTADAQNTKGIVISIEYDYEVSSQFYPASPTATRKLYKAFRVPDNGSYTLQMTDLNEMFPGRDIYQPFNAMVFITVGRANYDYATSADGLQKYAIYAGSAAERPILINWKARPRVTS